jgi:hypothetical protein
VEISIAAYCGVCFFVRGDCHGCGICMQFGGVSVGIIRPSVQFRCFVISLLLFWLRGVVSSVFNRLRWLRWFVSIDFCIYSKVIV